MFSKVVVLEAWIPFFNWNPSQFIWGNLGSRVRSSSDICLLRVSALKSAGPSRVPSDCVWGDSSQDPSDSALPLGGGFLARTLLASFQSQFQFLCSPFLSRDETGTQGLISMGIDRDVALRATQSHKPSSTGQYQSGWIQFEVFP